MFTPYKANRGSLAVYMLVFFALCVHHAMVAQDIPAPVFEKRLHSSQFTPTLMVSTSFDAQLHERFSTLKANIGAEVWKSFTLEDTDTLRGLSESEKDTAVLNTLFRVQSLEGIEYYSHSRKQYRAFIIQSYTVDSLKNKNRIDDMVHATHKPMSLKEHGNDINVYELLWFRQDSSFGSGVLTYTVFHNVQAQEFYIDMQNLQTIRYKNILPIAEPRSMAMGVLIKRDGDTYNVYALSGVKASDVPIKSLRERVGISIMYRLHATILWFEKTLQHTMHSTMRTPQLTQ